MGASAEAEQALAVPVEPASGLAPTGFDPSRLLELAERCEHGTADRKIMCEIGKVAGLIPAAAWPHSHGGMWWADGMDHGSIPDYFVSLDAAKALVPEGWAWAGEFSDYSYAAVWDDTPDYDGKPNEARAATPAFALCAAALKARAASAIEARSDAAPKSDAAEGESAIPKGDAR